MYNFCFHGEYKEGSKGKPPQITLTVNAMDLPTNGESNKGFINESAKPSKYFPSYAMIWVVCEQGFI